MDKLLLQSEKARILSATISREAVRSFVSNPEPREVQRPDDVLGIDALRCRMERGSSL